MKTVTIANGTHRAELVPARGGMLTSWTIGDRSMLYLDEATLADPTKNVRGGNPVLFPTPGKLREDRFERAGKSGSMKQHGVARNMVWAVASQDASSATLTTKSNDETRAQFPWDFVLTTRYALENGKLRIEHAVENTSKDPLPFAYGFHPYFAVREADKAKTKIPTKATRAWDNVAKKVIAIEGSIDLAKPEVDLHLDHRENHASLVFADGKTLHIRGSSEYSHCWVVWTVAGKDYVCLEPWTAGGNAMNDGDFLINAAPGEKHALLIEMELV